MAEAGAGIGEDLDDLADLLDAWARQWEKEFELFSSAETDYLARVADRVRLFAERGIERASSDGRMMAALLEESDARAQMIGQRARQLSEVRRQQEVEDIDSKAGLTRYHTYHTALEETEEVLRNISERKDAERREREEKFRENLRVQRQRRAERRTNTASGGSGGAGTGSGGARRASEPPRFAKPPFSNQAAARKTEPTAALRLDTAAAYDKAWAAFEQRLAELPADGPTLGHSDVPWPSKLPTVSGIDEAADGRQARRIKFRSAMLRWHPDKWGPILARIRETDRAQVMEGVKAVTRRILDERRRFGS